MNRDNEKILSLICEVESFIQSRLAPLVEANASASTISSFVQCLQDLERATNNLGEVVFGEIEDTDCDDDSDVFEVDHSDVIETIVKETMVPVENRLIALIERLEGMEGDRND
ncbi:MAG: hypothetical protein KME45_02875 [Stenomitos rutilans HA7619-LM2]|jgi:hypothetical protein|nr:hypothetical protein [Stenomitos rutilans HA7619-LM2]MBW4469327.1 hypothetical protein [Stenomitos rutilans HA7619-LM2]